MKIHLLGPQNFILAKRAYLVLVILLPICLYSQTPNSSTQPGAGTQAIHSGSDYATGTSASSISEWDAAMPFSTESDLINPLNTVDQVMKTTQYVDGLGRPLQTVIKAESPLGYDMVSPVEYDQFGREQYKFLPYISTNHNDGSFKLTPFSEQQTFMSAVYNPTNDANGEKYFYSQTDYDGSPLNRVVESYAPGNSWVGDAVGTTVQYLANTTGDNVYKWSIGYNGGDLPVQTGLYAAGELYKSVYKDENGSNVQEYKDQDGHTILKKVEISQTHVNFYDGWLCTYYIYDDFGNLRFVIQPKAISYLFNHSWSFEPGATSWSTSATATGYCFSYDYDERKRMIVKRVPGAGETWMVYDSRDRIVMTQDEDLRNGQNVWMTTFYDDLNRPVEMGKYIDNNLTHDRAWQQNQVNTVSNYPSSNSSNFFLFTETLYDEYTWIPSIFNQTLATKNITNTTYFFNPSNTTFPYPQAITANYQTRGMVTGTITRVLASNPADFFNSINFYDDRGRLIQTQSNHYNTVGTSIVTDTVTMQYSFSGQLLRTFVAHTSGGTNPQYHRVCTKNVYDNAGRLIQVSKIIGNANKAGAEVIISRNQYNELGQLKEKDLGQQVDALNTTSYSYLSTPIDVLKYEFNVRGWLRGINKDYARNTGNSTAWFGMELSYDYGFTATQLNGNIAGERWRSRGDGEQRAYGFNYDEVNRLTSADYNQLTGSTWDKTKTDFSTTNLTYDNNGNILTMNQMGMQANNIVQLDQLNYTYITNSNQLDHVKDLGSGWNSTQGDFKEINHDSNNDYSYDPNGNMTVDNNKGISNIAYDYLNQPQIINISNKGKITYTYDALGNKIRKVVVDNTVNPSITTTTDYIGLFTYQNDTLQYINTEEGRARETTRKKVDTMYYDYFEKDHLGNVRVVLTDQLKQDMYPVADLENQNPSAITIEQQYYDIKDDAGHIVDESSITGFNGTTTNEYQNNNGNPPYNTNAAAISSANSTKLYKLNGATGDKTGLGITLKVMSGDVIDIFGKSYWHGSGGSVNNSNSITSALLNFITTFAGSTAVTVAGHGATATSLNGNTNFTSPLSGWLNGVPNPGSSSPKAYINWILFDEQFNTVSSGSGFDAVSTTTDALKSHHKTVNITRNGFLYIYCSNESNIDVFFDNLQVVHTHGPLVSEDHYYPFGLTMSGISSQALNFGTPENKKGFSGKELQNKEFSDGSGLEAYDFGWRMQDPQLGVWHNPDPLADRTPSISPYVYCADNPIMLIDPDGRTISGDTNMVKQLESTAGNIKKSEEANQARLQKRIDKREAKGKSTAGLQRRMAESQARVSEIDGLLSNISTLEASDQDYHVTSNWTPPADGTSGETVYNPKTGSVDINISASYGLSGLAHELTHGYQFDQGLTDLKLDGSGRGFLHDITDEMSAFRRQFAINPGSLSNIKSIFSITDSYVRGLNSQYSALPFISLDHNTPLHVIQMAHTWSSGITYFYGGGLQTYLDAKGSPLLSNYISR